MLKCVVALQPDCLHEKPPIMSGSDRYTMKNHTTAKIGQTRDLKCKNGYEQVGSLTIKCIQESDIHAGWAWPNGSCEGIIRIL